MHAAPATPLDEERNKFRVTESRMMIYLEYRRSRKKTKLQGWTGFSVLTQHATY